jgi:hypothetical protein
MELVVDSISYSKSTVYGNKALFYSYCLQKPNLSNFSVSYYLDFFLFITMGAVVKR